MPDGVVKKIENAGSLARCEPVDVICAGAVPHVVPPLRGAQFRTRFCENPEFGSGNPPFSLQGADPPFFPTSPAAHPPLSSPCVRNRSCLLSTHPDPRPHLHAEALPFAAGPLFRRPRHSGHPCVPGIPAMRDRPETCRSRFVNAHPALLPVPWIPRGSLPSSGLLEAASRAAASVRYFEGPERRRTENRERPPHGAASLVVHSF